MDNKPHPLVSAMLIFIVTFITVTSIRLFLHVNQDAGNGVTSMLNLSNTMYDLFIGVVTSLVTSILATIVMYFAFLRKIPEKTKEQVEDMINKRLIREGEDLNTVLGQFNDVKSYLHPNNSHLSREHDELRTITQQTLTYLEAEKAAQEARRVALSKEQADVRQSLVKLGALENMMEEVNIENKNLKIRNAELEAENSLLKATVEQQNRLIECNGLAAYRGAHEPPQYTGDEPKIEL